MGFFRDFANGLNRIFLYDPDQLVNGDDEENLLSYLAEALKRKLITIRDGSELVRVLRENENVATSLDKSVADGVKLLPSDIGDNPKPNRSRKIDDRPPTDGFSRQRNIMGKEENRDK